METFDYVIVGGGSAGCVLANRLSADPKIRVALLEAGGKDDWIWFHIPVGYLFAIGNPRADWCFQTEPDPGLNGRSLKYPRGKVLGGSSAINAMLYLRGQSRDYDGWRRIGLDGWGWDDVFPVFKAHEDHFRGASPIHGAGGEWRVDAPRMRWEILDAFADAAEECGIPKVADFNGGDNEGSSYFQVNQKNGRRWSAARGFLKPAADRPNLTVITGALADRVLFEGTRAVGVAYVKAGREERVGASAEVILAAGAVASPPILERSGIGDPARLAELGVATVAAVPGVGENLQDHLQLRTVFKVEGTRTLNTDYPNLLKRAWMGLEYALFRRGPLAMAPSQFGAFTRSSPEVETPNLEFHIQPLSLDRFGEPMHPFAAFTVSVCNLRPTSRGSIHARSRDPAAAPVIRPNYLSTEEDRRVAVESLRLARRVVAAAPLARFRPTEHLPGADRVSDAALAKAAGDVGTTIFHPVGTAKMSTADDPAAVTDARLRVRGVSGLRVVDASVMPTIVSGNTNSPTIMIADKGAAMILADRAGR
ncbi:GMC family oxidoreductase [Pinisolibacter aquiterrae]|uniref:GMC family oxidoreductase n=1 Tax=Pinisolibacter aquiterrae TaxID=2815579 RepID=UPI001C3E83C9|nr:GMC family oxidoreductase N-terminal domain-containing protein [Pinisolibacter aquiterrae]MBV5265572.1 GMC family oxidoreductase N-terminal domain-containing protein [Pinisolibacter aquiterrae]MCC8236861.1 GMC family oxidoreductase N-terminal domain-containing protein [Pinisolibacter aquiterrae]